MSRRTPQLPPDVEADVAARLHRALTGGLGDVPVDVAGLAAGTRAGIRRAAVRRTVSVAAAAVAAVAVPLGVVVLGPGLGGSTGGLGPAATASSTPPPSPPSPTTGTPKDPATSPTENPAPTDEGVPVPDPRTTVSPLDTVLTSDNPNEVAYLVRDEVALQTGDFPTPVVPLLAVGDYRYQPTVPGQGCGTMPRAKTPVAGNQWMWAEESSNRLDQLTVSLIVTGWEPGTAPDRFAEVVADSGPCKHREAARVVPTTGMSGDEQWAASFSQNGSATGRAAVRVGDVIVGVEVVDGAGRASAVALAKDLADLVAQRAVSTGLVTTAAGA